MVKVEDGRELRLRRGVAILLSVHLVMFVQLAFGATVVVDSDYDQQLPAVAHEPLRNRYIVVWEHYQDPVGDDIDIYGRWLDAEGTPVTSPFPIAAQGSYNREAPQVACDDINGQCLVVWEHRYASGDFDLYGLLLNSDGTLSGGETAIAVSSDSESNAALAYNPANQEYLVVWEQRTASNGSFRWDIRGQRLAGSGVLQGGALTIASGGGNHFFPAVVHGSRTDEYLVVWQYDDPLKFADDIYAQRVTGTGTLVGSQLEVAVGTEDHARPRVAYNWRADDFLVVWQEDSPDTGIPTDIRARRVSAGGSLLGSALTVDTNPTGANTEPAVAYKEFSSEYIAVWEQSYSEGQDDIYRRRIAGDGLLFDETRAVSVGTAREWAPAVASANGPGYLIVWGDNRNSATSGSDIYAESIEIPVLSGYVYEGLLGDRSQPFGGVDVSLHCSADAVDQGNLAWTTTTDDSGHYGLPVSVDCNYYNIVETQPAGYEFIAATSDGGAPVDSHRIRYEHPLEGKTPTGNEFWAHNPPPILDISHPLDDAVVSESVDVIGSVSDGALSSWSLGYGAGSTPSTWVLLGIDTFPISGVLGTWETTALPDGTYTLRLLATDIGGKTSELRVSVTVAQATPTGTVTVTSTSTPTQTPTQSGTVTQTATPSVTRTGSLPPTSTPSPTPTLTGTATNTPTASVTRTGSRPPTDTPSVTPTDTATPTTTSTPTRTPTTAACPGDCDGSGDVNVSELIRGVNIALGNAEVDECPAMDDTGDGSVTVDELVRAVNAALGGCPG